MCTASAVEKGRAYKDNNQVLIEVRQLVAARDDIGTRKETAEALVGQVRR